MSDRQASTFRKESTVTFIQSSLGNHLNKAGIPYKFDFEVPREEGKYPYRLDIVIEDAKMPFRLYLECYGKGTASDDFERDRFLRERGILPVYFANNLVKDYPAYVVRQVKEKMLLLKALWL